MVFSCYIINFDQFENVSSQCWWVFFILPRPEQKGINDFLSLTLTVCNSHTHTNGDFMAGFSEGEHQLLGPFPYWKAKTSIAASGFDLQEHGKPQVKR